MPCHWRAEVAERHCRRSSRALRGSAQAITAGRCQTLRPLSGRLGEGGDDEEPVRRGQDRRCKRAPT
eukprot:15470514-Alexandrium_andersonii.AAC.1